MNIPVIVNDSLMKCLNARNYCRYIDLKIKDFHY